MKKYLFILFISLGSGLGYSQTPLITTKTIFSTDYVNEYGLAYVIYPKLNKYYTTSTAPDSLAMTGVGVSFKDMVEAPWYSASNTFTAFSPTFPVHLDKLTMAFMHENNSGTNDTLVLYIKYIDTTGYPAGPVIWSDTLITNTSLLYPLPYLPYEWNIFPSIFLSGKFFVGFDYMGSLQDTLGVYTQFDNQSYYFSPLQANENPYGNVYRWYPAATGWLPDQNGYDFYYDWNNNGVYDSLNLEANYMQSIRLGAQFTYNIASIMGTVYNDQNNNGVQDAGEAGIPNLLVTSGSYTATTNSSGDYSLAVPPGTYNVQVTGSAFTTSPGSINVTVGAVGQTYPGNDFALHFISNIQDLKVTLTDSRTPRPNFPRSYIITYENTGTVTMNGTVNFVMDASQSYTSANPAPTTINGNTYTWSFTGLLPFESRNIQVSEVCPATVPLGTILHDSAWIIPIAGDVTPADNSDTLSATVVNSFDPNEKTVSPAGIGAAGYISGNEDLTYTIRFQNTGTAPAIDVVVEDTISPMLDLSTFTMLSASHNYSYMITGRVVKWVFHNIMLADSTSNEPASHGFVKFSIMPNTGLQDGTVLNNTGYIYFDLNPAVVTNTTINTVSITGMPGATSNSKVEVKPNPASNEVSFLFDKSIDAQEIVLFDIAGKEVKRMQVTDPSIRLSVNDLDKGVYLYRVSTQNDEMLTGRLVVLRAE